MPDNKKLAEELKADKRLKELTGESAAESWRSKTVRKEHKSTAKRAGAKPVPRTFMRGVSIPIDLGNIGAAESRARQAARFAKEAKRKAKKLRIKEGDRQKSLAAKALRVAKKPKTLKQQIKATKIPFDPLIRIKHRPGMGKEFYRCDEWRKLRVTVLREQGAVCHLCGHTKETSGYPLHVDHIIPRSKRPDLELVKSNLAVLCLDCNMGKGSESWASPA